MRRLAIAFCVLIGLAAAPAYAASPDELYQTWQANNREHHEVAANAAGEYLRKAPNGDHAAELRAWLDAYHKALSSLGIAPHPPAASRSDDSEAATAGDTGDNAAPHRERKHKAAHASEAKLPDKFLYADLVAVSNALSEAQKSEARNVLKIANGLEATGDYVAAGEAFKRALDIDPCNGPGNFDYAENLEKQNNPARAFEYYFRAVTFGGDSPEAFKAVAAIERLAPGAGASATLDLIVEGNKYFSEGNFQGAIAAYSQVIKYVSNASFVLARRGESYAAQNALDAASSDCNQAIAIAPNYDEAYFCRGVVDQRRGNLSDASADYTKAIGLNAMNIAAILNRGWTNLNMKQYNFATNDANEVMQKLGTPPQNGGYLMQAYGIRAKANAGLGAAAAAAADYEQELALDPNNPVVLNDVCYQEALLNTSLDRALAHCNAALAIKPNEPDTLDSRGFVYFRMGQFDQAIADYDRVLAIVPKLADTLYHRGIAKLRKNDTAGGQADIAAALAINPHVSEEMTSVGVTP